MLMLTNLSRASIGPACSFQGDGPDLSLIKISTPLACYGLSLQVIEHKSTHEEVELMERGLKAILELQLEHPNVVRIYKYTTRQTNAVRSLMPSASASFKSVEGT